MPIGAITNYIDVAQLTLYVFWFFFFALIFGYIRREDKREGYPVQSLRMKKGEVPMEGFPPLPQPKTFTMPLSGAKVVKPGPERPQYELRAKPTGPWPGAPLEPIGDPMLAAVGPGSYGIRAEEPDMADNGLPRIVPMRVATHFSVVDRDPDPRGMAVIGCDGEQGGVCREIWVDRSEPQIRYLELDTSNGKRVLVPITLARVNGKMRQIKVRSIKGEHFNNAPTLKNYDQITLQEEDKVVAYYGGGTLYATPERAEPLL